MEAYLKKHKVTQCPGMFSPELIALNRSRQQAWNAMTPDQRRVAAGHRPRGRRPTLPQTPERVKKNAYQREYLRKKRMRQE